MTASACANGSSATSRRSATRCGGVAVTGRDGGRADARAGLRMAARRTPGRRTTPATSSCSSAMAAAPASPGHLAIDFSKNGNLRALAFNDPMALTCVGNDLGYDNVFAKQIEIPCPAGRPADRDQQLGHDRRTSSRRSRRRARATARSRPFRASRPTTTLRRLGDVNFYVPASEYGFVEISHLALCHAVLDIDMGWGAEGINRSTEQAMATLQTRAGDRRRRLCRVEPGAEAAGRRLRDGRARSLSLRRRVRRAAVEPADRSQGRPAQPGRRGARALRLRRRHPSRLHLQRSRRSISIPELGRSINYDCFRPLVRAAKDAGVRRFIYASSSSVYGVKRDANVTEDLALEPLTDYSKYKALCEEVLEAGARARLRRP